MESGVTILDLKITDYQANKPESITQGINYNGKISLIADIGANDELKRITVRVDATIFLENNVKNLINIGQITSETIFSLSGPVWDARVKKENGNFIINAALETYLIGISYDSLRGLMREKSKNSFLEKVLLPLVNPADITRADKADKNANK
ncbi:hypothetical protein [Chitinophaga arvensicola]|uniref:Uncharacterized protein n=1 Tax=Chitinophaga arvensicola TaxID=29529 RepID=A0A1I0R1P4_9BACT|nr:hypothetical protein [Chitinophaga arvensicola]SEW34218.1 hypothetical protein SAMN04488122_2076 [Chitinophaga arvensicola]